MPAIRNPHHKDILALIVARSGKATRHTYLDNYLGNTNKRYAIDVPTLRSLAKEWMRSHVHLAVPGLERLLTSLVKGESSTEKCMVGILLDYATKEQWELQPSVFDTWLDHLQGWAEIDSLCSGKFVAYSMPRRWKEWARLIKRFSKSSDINKRRASLVLFIPAVRGGKQEQLCTEALVTIDRLKAEHEILITKAISWLLRSLLKHHTAEVKAYLDRNKPTLPAIAVRETGKKLLYGRKNP